MVGALILGLVAGFVGRALVPNDAFSGMHGPKSWAVSIALGLVGAFVGYVIVTLGLGLGDDDAFDLGRAPERHRRRRHRPAGRRVRPRRSGRGEDRA